MRRLAALRVSKGAVEQIRRVGHGRGLCRHEHHCQRRNTRPDRDRVLLPTKSEARIEGLKKAFPLGPLCEPNEVVGMVTFLPGKTASG